METPAIPSDEQAIASSDGAATRWYSQVTRYQWLVLAIASAGWIFDAFEGQLYNLTRQDLLHDLLRSPNPSLEKFWGDLFLSTFLLGGTIGGVLFGSLADRIGRKPAMAITILFYSLFSGLTCFATTLWHVAALRFLVAMGVGGEWAVGASIVAEVFPQRARARAGGIFHGSSVAGTWMAAIAGLCVGVHWRYAYLVGIIPALLVFWVRAGISEPKRWRRAGAEHKRLGSLKDLFSHPAWGRRALLGLLLAAVGLGTFWSITVAGQDLTRELLIRRGYSAAAAAERAKFAFGIIQAIGFGIGLFSFGPMAERLGRRGAFLLMHLCAIAIVPVTCYLPHTYWQMLLVLPFFGFFTAGMHSGYAIYFPELFPDHLRATGAAVCFNGGRFLAAPLLWLSGSLKSVKGLDLRSALVILSSMYLIGAALLIFLPETRGEPLPE